LQKIFSSNNIIVNRGVTGRLGRRRLFEIQNFFSPVGGAAAAFIDYGRRGLESLQMKNSFQNKKNICLFRYLNFNLLKKL
jgi:hypothetical protein